MRECPECDKKFPSHLIQPMYIVNVEGIESGYHSICSLCALEITNNIHGMPEGTPFRGEMAQALYEETVEYARKNH